jgi:RNA polymerase sigma-70 factor (ECF subfamily)
MQKPVKPGLKPDARIDVTRDSGPPVVPRPRTVRAEGMFGAAGPDGPGNDLNLHDAWLVEHARHGDHQAFAVLVRRYERKLIRVLTRLIHQPEQARDLAQETFWRVYTRLDQFDTARRFGPWLFRVGVNLGLDWLRSSKSGLLRAASIDRADHDGQATVELPDQDPRIQAELAQEVQFILGLIPVGYRTILVLRDLEGFSSSEVAAIVGRREATVRWRLAKAREKFREIWERRQDGAPRRAKESKISHEHDDGEIRV